METTSTIVDASSKVDNSNVMSFTHTQIHGLGDCRVSRKDVMKAITAYHDFLVKYALQVL